jgi:hypothetical protein
MTQADNSKQPDVVDMIMQAAQRVPLMDAREERRRASDGRTRGTETCK